MSCAAGMNCGFKKLRPQSRPFNDRAKATEAPWPVYFFLWALLTRKKQKKNQLELLTATARIRCDSNYASLTRRAIIIFDHPLCLNHSMCWAAAHHLRRRQSGWGSHHRLSKCGMQFVFHPWLFQPELTTHIHALSRHTVAAGSGWCSLLTGAGCQ